MTPANPLDMTGRRVLVTGASSGIGREAARLLAGLRARLVVGGRDRARLEAVLAELPGEGHAAAPFDLGEMDAIPGWLKGLAADGPFHGIAHCAGIQTLRPIRMVDHAFFAETMRVNLGSGLALAKGFRQKGVHGAAASLVFVSSTAATAGSPANVVYAASKAGLIAAAKGLALELKPDDIRVNCVVPSIVMTELIERGFEKLTAEQVAHLERLQPLGFGAPRDVAGAIAFLLAGTGRWITGTALTVDGGRTA